MVVYELDVYYLAALEPKHDTPVAGHTDAPLTRSTAFQWVQPVAGSCIDVVGPLGLVQDGQDAAQAGYQAGRQPGRTILLSEGP